MSFIYKKKVSNMRTLVFFFFPTARCLLCFSLDPKGLFPKGVEMIDDRCLLNLFIYFITLLDLRGSVFLQSSKCGNIERGKGTSKAYVQGEIMRKTQVPINLTVSHR